MVTYEVFADRIFPPASLTQMLGMEYDVLIVGSGAGGGGGPMEIVRPVAE